MRLEEQVCSLELSKRLKELGVKQESHFWWATEANAPFDKEWYLESRASIVDRGLMARQHVCAFTVAELGKMLPPAPFGDGHNANLVSGRENKNRPDLGNWWCGFITYEEQMLCPSKRADTEANARCLMLIHLIDTGVVKP